MEKYDLIVKNFIKKVSVKRLLLTLLLILTTFLTYTLIGGITPFLITKNVNEEYKNSFDINKFYSNDNSEEKALLIEDNDKAFELMIRTIESANTQIIISSYKYFNDYSGIAVLSALYNASKKGVKIDIILDGLTTLTSAENQKGLKALNSLENTNVLIYNKINVFTPWKHNGRMHDKYVIIDENVYIIGGRNLGNSSLSNNFDNAKFDRDVLIYNKNTDNKTASIYQLLDYNKEKYNSNYISPLSNSFSSNNNEDYFLFLEDFYTSMKQEFPTYFTNTNFDDLTFKVNKVNIITNPIHPYNKEPLVFYSLIELMNSATTSVKIHTPYIIMDNSMYAELKKIGQKDFQTTIFTNSIANNENPFGANELRISKDKILNTGFDLYEFEGGVSYHAKTISIDNRLSIIGSFNMDMRSAYIDTEIMVVIDSIEINEQLNKNLKDYESQSVFNTKDIFIIPEGIEQQKLTLIEKIKLDIIFIISHWLRFLM